MAEKSNFKIYYLNVEKIRLCHENVRQSVKFQYFEVWFFANILIYIGLTDSTKQIRVIGGHGG